MPMPCDISIEDSSIVAVPQGLILVQAIKHLADVPKNPQTGLPAGKRVHQGMTLTKEIDKSSPKLFQALTSGEQLKTVNLVILSNVAKRDRRAVLRHPVHRGAGVEPNLSAEGAES